MKRKVIDRWTAERVNEKNWWVIDNIKEVTNKEEKART